MSYYSKNYHKGTAKLKLLFESEHAHEFSDRFPTKFDHYSFIAPSDHHSAPPHLFVEYKLSRITAPRKISLARGGSEQECAIVFRITGFNHSQISAAFPQPVHYV